MSLTNTFRQDLLPNVATWLGFITAANGYDSDIVPKRIFKGRLPLNDAGDTPTMWYHLGDGRVELMHDDNSPKRESVDLFIAWQGQSEVKEGALTDLAEKAMKNLDSWIWGDTELANLKWFMPHPPMTEYDSHECIDKPVYFDWDKNKCELVYKIKIFYNKN